MHKAFERAVVADRLPTRALGAIESIASYGGNKLLLGTAKGQLLLYSLKTQGGVGPADLSVKLLETKPVFARRAITQLECIPELNLLLSLSDGYVSVHELHSLMERSLIQRTRATVRFAISVTQEDTKGGPRHPQLKMCCIMKKQLLVFNWTGSDFVERKVFPMPDTPKQVVWCGDSIFVGFRREYYLLDTIRGTTNVLFPTGRDMEPLMTKINDFEVLLNKDNVSIFIGRDGRLTRRFGINWNVAPTSMTHVSGFCIGLLPKAIEIRSVETQALVQTIDIAAPKVIVAGKSVSPETSIEAAFLFTEAGGVYTLLPVPLDLQIEDLVEANEYDDALLLAERLPEGTAQKNKVHGIKLLQAFHLFETGRYEESLDLFAQLDTDPPIVIGLYPNLLPDWLREEIVTSFPIKPPTLNEKDLNRAQVALINFLSLKRDRLERRFIDGLPQADGVKELWQIIDTTLLNCFLAVSPSRLPRLLRRPNHCYIQESEKMLRAHKRANELAMLYQYKGMDIKALDFLRAEADDDTSPLFGVYPTIDYLKTLTCERIRLILTYSTWPLQVNPKEALKIFIEGRSEEVKPKSSDDYFAAEDDAQATRTPSNVVIQKVREQTVNYLTRHGRTVLTLYLEHLIYTKQETWPRYHNQLAAIYVDQLKALWPEFRTSGLKTDHEASAVRHSLCEFLEFSELYNAETLLADPIFKELLDERAILLGRVGRHEDVLKIYAYRLKDTEKAVAYCTKLYKNGGTQAYLSLLKILVSPNDTDTSDNEPDEDTGESEHTQALDLHLHPGLDVDHGDVPVAEGVSGDVFRQRVPMIEPALKLLTEHGDKIDTIEALNALPRDCQLSSVYPFLNTMMQSTAKRWRMNLLIKNLAKSLHLKEQEELYRYRGRATVVGETRTCPVCSKRLGLSAIAFCPSGTVLHYGCLDNYQEQAV